ncbi:integrase [Apibacter muscae]|uniref:site-specific integrase n=1 Tax=Apibacter muscae TaxID=2509004 RepID=UPI0011AC3575|nr:site-specific integrase [Apibacter muscae]TWP24277.1 integrase [Apibacter muscae]TWP30162.1 integrase [Apibacter muscae]
MKVRFYITKQKNPYSTIHLRFWHGRKYDFKTSTELVVKYEDWNNEKEVVRNKVTAKDKDFINNTLANLRQYIIENFNTEYNSGLPISKMWLKNKVSVFFNRVDESKPEQTYYTDWVTKFIETASKRLYKGKPISQSTLKKYVTTRNYLVMYEEYKKTKLLHQDITMNFYYDFVDYCKTIQKVNLNTIGTYIGKIKFFCGQIALEGLPISNHYKNSEFMGLSEQTEDIYLTIKEIETIYNLDLSTNPRLDNVRDLFIIGLNTGLRVSDFMRLDLTHIKDDTIRIKAQKTGKIAEIPINNHIEQTLAKRNGNLPKAISEQKFNEYIKELGKLAGLTQQVQGAKINKETKRKEKGTYPKYELITSHICRRSFATNLYGQIPTPVIMSITGHATETQFLTYIKKTNAENAEVLRNFYKKSMKEKGLKPMLKIIK